MKNQSILFLLAICLFASCKKKPKVVPITPSSTGQTNPTPEKDKPENWYLTNIVGFPGGNSVSFGYSDGYKLTFMNPKPGTSSKSLPVRDIRQEVGVSGEEDFKFNSRNLPLTYGFTAYDKYKDIDIFSGFGFTYNSEFQLTSYTLIVNGAFRKSDKFIRLANGNIDSIKSSSVYEYYYYKFEHDDKYNPFQNFFWPYFDYSFFSPCNPTRILKYDGRKKFVSERTFIYRYNSIGLPLSRVTYERVGAGDFGLIDSFQYVYAKKK